MPNTLLSPTWAELAGSVVVNLLWQGTLIGVLLAVALAATRRRSPNLRYALACVGLLLITALLPANFAWLATRDTSVSPPAATRATADPSPAPATPEPAFSPSDQSDRSDLSDSSSPDRPARPSLSATQWYHLCLPWLGRLWAVGIVSFALYDLAGLFALRRLRAKSQAVGDDIAALARRIQDRLGVHARVQVHWLAGISSALVTGFFHTIILLPASMATRMTSGEIEAILAHEFAHIRRWDLWVNAFQRVVEALLFFHPVVWWLSKTIRAERELCCDELALRAYPDRAQYVRALLTLAETTQQTQALALSSHGGDLVSRVRRILGHRQKGEPSMRRRALGTLVGVVVAMSLLLVAPVLQSVQSASESRDISERQTWKTEQVIEFQVALRETSYKSGDLLDSGKFSTASSHLLSVTPGGPQHVVSSVDGVIVEAKWRNATESRSNVKAPAVHLEGFQWRLRNTLEYGNDTRSYPWSGAEDLYLERDWHILKTPVSVSSTYEGAPTLVLRCRWTEVTSQPGKLDLQAVGSLAQDRDEALAQIRAAEANLRNAQWGEPVSGLQAGLMYEDAPRSFRVGETVGFVLMLRNISDQPIKLDYVESAQNSWVPEVRDSAGTAAPVLPLVLSTVRRIPQFSLAPGEARILDRGLLTIQSLGWGGPVNGVVAFCEKGRYSVRYTFPFGPDSNGHSRLFPWVGDVTTGELEMEIVSPQVGSTLEDDGRVYSNGDIRTVLHILSEVDRLTHIPSDGGIHDWEMLRDNWAARCAALSVGAVTYLEHVATDWLDEGYRAAACDALGDTQQPSVCEVLVECLADPSANVRRTAARSLGELGSESNVPRLAQLLLSDPDAIVRMSAAYALGHIASNQATQTLVSALQHDDDDSVKQAAALALGWITDASALPALKEALPQTDGLLRDHIEAAIRNIEDPDYWGLGVKKGVPEHEAVGRNEESTRALFEAFLMSERSLTMLPGNMDLGWKDIPTLLKLAEDTSLVDTKNRTFGRMLLTEVPATPFTGNPQSWAVRGMISLWIIEGIRCGYGASFRPPLYGFCFKDDLTQAQCEASDTIHKETLAAYQKWWDAVKELPIEEAAVIDPLLGTGLRWCVPQQPRPPTAAPSQPEPRPSAVAPASPISGLPEPPFTIEEVAAYHREKTGTDLPIDKLKQLYTNIVLHDHGKGGDISGIKDDARRALAFEQDELTRLQLYLGLSDGYYVQPDTPWVTQRKNLAKVMLVGLREILQNDLPDDPPDVPGVGRYNIDGSGEVNDPVREEAERKHVAQMAAHEKAKRIAELVRSRIFFTQRLISEYHYREPSLAAYEELYTLALEYLGDQTAAQQLREGAESYQGSKSPVPVLRLPDAHNVQIPQVSDVHDETHWVLAHLVLPKDWSPTQQLEVLESVTAYQQIASMEMGKSRYACRFVIPSGVWEQVIERVRASGTSVGTYTDEDSASFDKWFPKQKSWWKDSDGYSVTLDWWNPESINTPKRIGWQEHLPNTPRKWVWALYGQNDDGNTLVHIRVQTD